MKSDLGNGTEQIFGSWALTTLLLVALAGLSLVTEGDTRAMQGPPLAAEELAQANPIDL